MQQKLFPKHFVRMFLSLLSTNNDYILIKCFGVPRLFGELDHEAIQAKQI